MRVLVLTKYGSMGASSRIRFLQYIPYLKKEGFSFDISPLFDDSYLEFLYSGKKISKKYVMQAYWRRIKILFSREKYDLLWVQAELYPYIPYCLERLLSDKRTPVLVNYDDAIFHNYDMHRNPVVKFFLRNKIDRVMKNAAGVVVGNEYLEKRATLASAKHITNIPSVIDLDEYPKSPSVHNSEKLVIGWIGSHSTIHFLNDVASVLKEFAKDRKIVLVIIGVEKFSLDGVETKCYKWYQGCEAELLAKIDVGIMPLSDTPWSKGKCGFKLIQYMASFKPVIASPVGINKQIVQEKVNGFLAKTDDEWLRYLGFFYNNSKECINIGMRGRELVEQKYSVQVTVPMLKEAMLSVVGC